MRGTAILVSALVAGTCAGACGGGKDAAVCRREAAELSTLLSSMDHEIAGYYAGGVSLVTRTDVPTTTPARGKTVAIEDDRVSFEGRPFDDPRALEQLTSELAQGALIYLAVDEAATWAHVAPVLVKLEELGQTRLQLAFARAGTPVHKPPRSKIDDDLDRLVASDDGASKATELANMTSKLIKGCPQLQKSFGAVAADDGSSKAETLIRAIEPSLVGCNCNLDLPAFRSIMFRLLYVEKPQSSLAITLDRAGTALTIPSDTPWREAHTRFTPDARVAIHAP